MYYCWFDAGLAGGLVSLFYAGKYYAFLVKLVDQGNLNSLDAWYSITTL